MSRASYEITGELARKLPRYEFIALWLVAVTKKKANRGPLGLHVVKARGEYRVMSSIGGGTIVYQTKDPSLLFDYARRTQLGTETRAADQFRELAFTEKSA
jgi:hypothetical protein